MTQRAPQFLAVLPPDDVGQLARGLGLDPQDIWALVSRSQLVSTGLPQLMVPVRSLAALQAITLELGPVAHASVSAMRRTASMPLPVKP